MKAWDRRGWVLAVFGATLFGCRASLPSVRPGDVGPDPLQGRIAAGDRIQVSVKGHAEASGEFLVRPNGSYLQPLVGPVRVAGLSPESATQVVRKALTGIIVAPDLSVSVSAPRDIRINVVGEVRRPGHYTVVLGEGVLGALARAGDLTEYADPDQIFVLRKTERGLVRIRFRYRELTGGVSGIADFPLADGDSVAVE